VTVFFSEVPPLASDALLTTLHPLLENVMQTVDHFEISCLGDPFFFGGGGWKSPEMSGTAARLIASSRWMSCTVYYPLFPNRTQNSIAQR
jgi:hypothetical protein